MTLYLFTFIFKAKLNLTWSILSQFKRIKKKKPNWKAPQWLEKKRHKCNQIADFHNDYAYISGNNRSVKKQEDEMEEMLKNVTNN